jgi:hypothetical protein
MSLLSTLGGILATAIEELVEEDEEEDDSDDVEVDDEVESLDEDRVLLDEADRLRRLLRPARSGSVEGDRDRLGPAAGSSSTVTLRTL